MRWKLANFMRNRNGTDELSRCIFTISLLFYLMSVIFRSSILYFVAVIGIFYSFFRVFSKDIAERQRENGKFIQFFQLQKKKFKMRKEYRVFTCKGCGQHIRVPKKKGKVEVTCPICGRKTIHRT